MGWGLAECEWNLAVDAVPNEAVQREAVQTEVLLLLAGDGFTCPTAGAGIGSSSLSADGEAHPVTTSSNAADVLKTLESHAFLTAQVTFDGVSLGRGTKLLNVAIFQVLDADIWINSRLGQDGLCPCEANSIDVSEGNLNPFVTGNVDAGDPCHVNARE